MSLTKEDLRAIKALIDGSIDEHVPKLVQPMLDSLEREAIKRIDELDGTLSMQMESGLREVRERIQCVEDKLDSVARVQQAEIRRSDNHSKSISNIRKALRTA